MAQTNLKKDRMIFEPQEKKFVGDVVQAVREEVVIKVRTETERSIVDGIGGKLDEQTQSLEDKIEKSTDRIIEGGNQNTERLESKIDESTERTIEASNKNTDKVAKEMRSMNDNMVVMVTGIDHMRQLLVQMNQNIESVNQNMESMGKTLVQIAENTKE